MNIDVSFMSGAGNLFTVIDNRQYNFSIDDGRKLAPRLCSGLSIPLIPDQVPLSVLTHTEGLMLIEPSGTLSTNGSEAGFREADFRKMDFRKTDFRMQFFNPDGSYGAMCGNGGRCAVAFARLHEFFTQPKHERITFLVVDMLYEAEFIGSIPNDISKRVRLYFPPAKEISYPKHVELSDGALLTVGYVFNGSDHVVVWQPELEKLMQLSSDSFDSFDVAKYGVMIRHHKDFPRGANANFYVFVGDHDGIPTLKLRTFERGVEAETGACGTGALATALIASIQHGIQPPIRIIPTSGSPLVVDFLPAPDCIKQMTLEGSADVLATQRMTVDL